MSLPRTLHVPTPPQDTLQAGRLILRDGSTATLRPAQPDDREALRDFFLRLSPESRYRRFFSTAVPETIGELCDSNDPYTLLTLLVTRTVAGREAIIATATYRESEERRVTSEERRERQRVRHDA